MIKVQKSKLIKNYSLQTDRQMTTDMKLRSNTQLTINNYKSDRKAATGVVVSEFSRQGTQCFVRIL